MGRHNNLPSCRKVRKPLPEESGRTKQSSTLKTILTMRNHEIIIEEKRFQCKKGLEGTERGLADAREYIRTRLPELLKQYGQFLHYEHDVIYGGFVAGWVEGSVVKFYIKSEDDEKWWKK